MSGNSLTQTLGMNIVGAMESGEGTTPVCTHVKHIARLHIVSDRSHVTLVQFGFRNRTVSSRTPPLHTQFTEMTMRQAKGSAGQ